MQKCLCRLAEAKHTDGSASLWVCGGAGLSGTQCDFRGRCVLGQLNKSQQMEAVTIMYQLWSASAFKGEKKHSRKLNCIQDYNNVILNATYKHAVRNMELKLLASWGGCKHPHVKSPACKPSLSGSLNACRTVAAVRRCGLRGSLKELLFSCFAFGKENGTGGAEGCGWEEVLGGQ